MSTEFTCAARKLRLVAPGVRLYFAGMASKSRSGGGAKPATNGHVPIETAGRRGRPPGKPRTHCARWLRGVGWTVKHMVDEMHKIAPRIGLPIEAVPQPKAMLDALNGRHWPQPWTILLVRHVTGGDVDLEHWVRDLYTPP